MNDTVVNSESSPVFDDEGNLLTTYEDRLKGEVARLKSELNSSNMKLARHYLPAEKITQDDIRSKVTDVRDSLDKILTTLIGDCQSLIAETYEYEQRSDDDTEKSLYELSMNVGNLYRLLKGYQFYNEYKVSGTIEFSGTVTAKSEEEAEELMKDGIWISGDYDCDADTIEVDEVKYQGKSKDC